MCIYCTPTCGNAIVFHSTPPQPPTTPQNNKAKEMAQNYKEAKKAKEKQSMINEAITVD